jgi:hypothetical protein
MRRTALRPPAAPSANKFLGLFEEIGKSPALNAEGAIFGHLVFKKIGVIKPGNAIQIHGW